MPDIGKLGKPQRFSSNCTLVNKARFPPLGSGPTPLIEQYEPRQTNSQGALSKDAPWSGDNNQDTGDTTVPVLLLRSCSYSRSCSYPRSCSCSGFPTSGRACGIVFLVHGFVLYIRPFSFLSKH